jgi:hypothetical protein
MPKTKRRTNKRRSNKRTTYKRTNRTKKMRGGVNWRAALSGLVLALAFNRANAMPGYTSGVVVDGNKIRMDETSYNKLSPDIKAQFTTDFTNLGAGKYVLNTDGCPQIFQELDNIKIQNQDPAVGNLVDNIQATSSCDNTRRLTAPGSNLW